MLSLQDIPIVGSPRLHLHPRSLAWWTWVVLACLLLLGLAGVGLARELAMAVAAGQSAVYFGRHRSLDHFPTQVRVAYAIWMAASFIVLPMFWIQAAGTTALTTVGYCPLARMLLVLPRNRSVPLTWQRLAVIAFHPPVRGSVRTELPL
jgi:hypothetical protein